MGFGNTAARFGSMLAPLTPLLVSALVISWFTGKKAHAVPFPKKWEITIIDND